MKDEKGMNKPVKTEIAGATVEAHGVMVTPVATVRGQAGANSDERGSWRYAWAAIRPTKMSVRNATGQTTEVKLGPTEGQMLGGMAAGALIVGAAAALISILARKR